MTSVGFLRLGDYDGSCLADYNRTRDTVDDSSADDRVLVRIIAHHDCWHTRANDVLWHCSAAAGKVMRTRGLIWPWMIRQGGNAGWTRGILRKRQCAHAIWGKPWLLADVRFSLFRKYRNQRTEGCKITQVSIFADVKLFPYRYRIYFISL